MKFISPLEQFDVYSLIGFHFSILKFNLTLTNLGLYIIFLWIIVEINYRALKSNSSFSGLPLVSSRWIIGLESTYTTTRSQVKEQIGSNNIGYLPFTYALFFFILRGNLYGNVPYSFTSTSSVIVAIGLSVMIFLGTTILAMYVHRLHFLSFFVPGGTPGPLVPLLILIEIISYLARAFSLGVRLFANIVAGHALLNILSGRLYKIRQSGFVAGIAALLPLVIFIALTGLELAVSVIQAYVFTVLTMTYIHDAEYLH